MVGSIYLVYHRAIAQKEGIFAVFIESTLSKQRHQIARATVKHLWTTSI